MAETTRKRASNPPRPNFEDLVEEIKRLSALEKLVLAAAFLRDHGEAYGGLAATIAEKAVAQSRAERRGDHR